MQRPFSLLAAAGIGLFGLFSGFASFAQSAPSPEVTRGITWLSGQVTASGSLQGESASIAAPVQARAETYLTLKLVASPSASTALADALIAESDSNVEFLSRKIMAQGAVPRDTAALMAQLRTLQNPDGGFGSYAGYPSNALDTAWAVQAMKAAGVVLPDAAVTSALGYLQSAQSADGAFAVFEQSSIYVTSQATLALGAWASETNVSAQTQSAVTYLLSQRSADGSWGNSVYLTSLAFAAVRAFQPQEPLATSIKAYLISNQAAAGSWGNDDPYVSALALRALQLASIPVSNPTLVSIHGSVIDAATRQPLSGVIVVLGGISTASVTTSGDGKFNFQNLQPGKYSLQLNLANYGALPLVVTASAGSDVDLGVLPLSKTPSGPTGTITGTITDLANGMPLSGVAISVTGITNPTYTDATGNYQINNAPVGSLTVQATKAGYRTAVVPINVVAGAVVVFSPQLSAGVSDGATVQGKVTNAATGAPMQGIQMYVFVAGQVVASALTDAQGNYAMTGLTSGAVQLEAVELTYHYGTVLIGTTLYPGNTAIFSPKLYSGTVPYQSNTATIKGIVVDAGTNAPLANVLVAATFINYYENYNVITGADGTFNITGLSSQTGNVAFTVAGYQGATTVVTMGPIGTADLGQVRLRRTQSSNVLPDLVVKGVSRGTAVTDVQNLTMSGNASATIANIGTVNAPPGVEALAFIDTNHNGAYDVGTDIPLGKTTLAAALPPGGQVTITIPVQGVVPFRDAPIHVWIDSAQAVVETSESNNVRSTAQSNTVAPAVGTFTPVVKWEALLGGVAHTPLVGPLLDTNGDGKIDQNDTPAVIAIVGSYMTAVSGLDGHLLWRSNVPLASYGVTPAMGDIDGDGKPEIFAYDGTGKVIAINNDGTTKWISSVPLSYGVAADDTALTIADLGNNPPGKANVIAGNLVLNYDGTLKWAGEGSTMTQSVPLVVDLDLDGSPEVVMGQNVYHADGSLYWKIPDSIYSYRNFPAVAHLDGDPYPQIVSTQYLKLVVFNHDGTIKWGPVGLPDAYNGGTPTVADIDGDGLPEVIVAGAGLFRVFNNDGSIKWTTRADDGSGVTGSTAFDFNNGGQMQLVYMNETQLRVFAGGDGATIFSTPNSSATWIEYPVVADVDNDGHADIIVASSGGIRVFKDQNNAWAPARGIWNQYNYHVTNINDDGSVPHTAAIGDNYRLQKKLNTASTGAIDLTASYVRISDKGGVTPSTLTVRIGNGGGYAANAGVKIAFFNGNPASGGTLLGTTPTTLTVNSGEYEDVSLSIPGTLANIGTLYVVADNNGAGVTALVDADRSNNTVSYVMTAQASAFAAQVVTDKLAYGANAAVAVNVSLTNGGSFAGSINVRGSIQTADGVNVAVLGGGGASSLPAQGSGTVALNWNTAATLIGDYFAVVELLDADGRVATSTRAMFTIVTDPPQPLVSVVYSDKSSYQFGENARLAGRVSNQSVNTIFNTLSLHTKVTGPAGSEVFNATRNLPQLAPGALTDSTLTMSLATAAPGSYIVEQQLINGAGATVQTKTARFEVRSTADTGAGIKGTLAVSPWKVNVGGTINFASVVTNVGNAAVTALPATLRIVDPVSGSLVQQLNITLNIGLQQQQTWNTTWTPAAALTAGTYVVALSIQPVSGERVLAQDIVQIGAVRPFTFAAITGAAVSSVQTSAAAQIDGIVIPETVQITGGQYSLNGGAFTSQAGQVQAGDTVVMRQTASASPGVKTTATITVGAYSTGFDVTTLSADTTPDAFAFAAVSNVLPSTVVNSNVVTIAGINAAVPVSITGGQYSINGGAFTAAAGTVVNGDTLALRQTASTQFNTTTTATVTVGAVSASFDVTTTTADSTPNAFSFAAQTGVAISTSVISNTVTIGGINTSAAVSVTGGTYSINGGAFTSAAGTLVNGDTLTLKQTSSAGYNTKTTATVTVGTVSSTFDVTTLTATTTPAAFSFTAQTNVAPGTAITSNAVTISGINTSVPISISGGQYNLNGGAFTAAAGTVSAGDVVTVRQTSSASFNTKTTATLTVSTVSATFDVTTLAASTRPNAFTFAAQTNVAVSTVATSNTVTISGINASTPVSITGGTYSINGGAYTSAAGSLVNGNTLTLRQTSSSSNNTKTTATVTVGGFAAAFDVTTLAADTTPDAFSFTAQTNVAVSTVATSNTVTISGINASTPVSITGGTYSINGGAYTSAAGTLVNGNTLTLRQTSSSANSTKTTATVTVGGISAAFDVTTPIADTTPDAYSFTAQTNVAVSTVATSNTVTISGINASTPVSITGGTYSINGGAYTSTAGTLVNGNTLTLRQTSSSANNTKTTATVTVGGVAAAFDVTTTGGVTTPNAFSFTAQSNVTPGTVVTSNTVTITGITVAVPISITGGQYSLNGGAFTTAAGTIHPNDTVTARLTASSSPATTTSAIVTISTVSSSFVVTTQATQAPAVTNEISRETRLLVLLSCKDSLGNADPACLESKKAFLNTYLTNQGLDFKLVTDTDSFKSEFRCGRYNTFWIAGGAVKLKDNLAEELREAVFRGDSLIVDGAHDSRNAVLDGVLGIQYTGNLSASSVLTTSATLPAGSFAFTGTANSVTATATVLAHFNTATGSAAIVQSSYGQGKGLVYNFDLVGTLQAQSSSTLLASVLNQSLSAVMPAIPANLTGDAYVPLDSKLVNGAASAQVVDVIATVPNTLAVVAPITPAATSTVTSGSNTIYTWRITLPANSTQYIDWAVRTPTTSGTYAITYQANLINGSTSAAITSNNLSLVVQAADQGAAQTVTALQALAPTTANERNARDRAVTDVQTATTKLSTGLYEDAVSNYLAATTELGSITTASVTATRTSIDRLMQEAGRKWCRGGTSCVVSSAGLPVGYNVTVFGSASFNNGQSDGSIGVGGAASLSSYTVAAGMTGDLARLVVGGSLTYSNGSVGQNGSGVIKVVGANSVSQNVGRASLTVTSVEDWNALKAQYLNFTDRLATQPGTAATIVSGNQFNCTGTNASFNVCNITGSQLTNARTLNLNYPNTASVLVNVTGTAAATMSNGQANWNGQALSGSQYASRVFFNFPQATGITISGFGIGGTILAPRASLAHSNSMIDGQVIVNTLSSTGSFKCTGTFQGSLPNLP